MRELLLVHAAATLVMVGVIWFVQIIHYPLFSLVGQEHFSVYAGRHQQLALRLLAVPMIVELLTAIMLAARSSTNRGRALSWVGLALLFLIWISTALFQLPRHRRLRRGFDPGILRGLLITNWLRTAAWTARGLIALAMFAPLTA